MARSVLTPSWHPPVSDDIKYSESLFAALSGLVFRTRTGGQLQPSSPHRDVMGIAMASGVLVLAFRRQTTQRPVFAVGIAFEDFGQLPIERQPFPWVVKPD